MKRLTQIILTLSFVCTAIAQTIETEGFSPGEIRPGDYATYRLVFRNTNGASVRPSDIPVPDGLVITGTSQSQNYSFINGRASSSVTHGKFPSVGNHSTSLLRR